MKKAPPSHILDLTSIMEKYGDEDRARTFFEDHRWPKGVVCPHCGCRANSYKLMPREGFKKHGRKGLWKCRDCDSQFTVTVGTIFEDSHIPLHKWLAAIYLLCSSKKGMSAHQLHRELGVTYKSAWFMAHRIRHAMTQEPLASKLHGIVEADETYVGGKSVGPRGRSTEEKSPVVTLIQRSTDRGISLSSKARSFHVDRVTGKNLKGIIRDNVRRDATIMTDSFKSYQGLGRPFASHETVNHGEGEYVRGSAHVNTAENFFSILKRGIIGTYHHVSRQHLHRYLSEFDFRYNHREVNDGIRALAALQGSKGKRLTYREATPKRDQSAEGTSKTLPRED